MKPRLCDLKDGDHVTLVGRFRFFNPDGTVSVEIGGDYCRVRDEAVTSHTMLPRLHPLRSLQSEHEPVAPAEIDAPEMEGV